MQGQDRIAIPLNPQIADVFNVQLNVAQAKYAISMTTEPTSEPPIATLSSSSIVHANVVSKDITTSFNQAALALRDGILVKDEPFSLFEAVGALEVGDPKMDSGFLEEGESMQAEYDCARVLSPKEIVWLMDELLCHEVAWLTGYPLSQTLFTSSYIDCLLWPEPKSLDDARFSDNPGLVELNPLLHKVFRAYCLALIKSCDLVHVLVTSEHYYEEEDFASQLFHRELLHPFAVEDVQLLVDGALAWLETAAYSEDVKAGIMQRLVCRQQIVHILQQNSHSRPSRQSEVHWQTDLVDRLQNSGRCGVPVPSSFSLKIQRTLASSVPPRPMVKVEYVQALAYFKKFFIESSKAFEVFIAEGSADVLAAYWLFMARKPQPSVYIRALLQSFLDQDGKILGRYYDKTFIFDDLQRLVLPASPLLNRSNDHVEVPSDRRFQITKHLDAFVLKSKVSFINLFRTACLNQCRIRRTLCHAVIEWDQLQAEAEDLDELIRKTTNEKPRAFPTGSALTYSYPLSSWVYHYKLCQMENLVQMGFELSVYAPDELPSMYWYLSHLCSIHLAHLDRISFFIGKLPSTQSRSMTALNDTSSEPISKTEASLQFLFRIFSRLKATEALATSLHLVYTILARLGRLSAPRRPYASDRLRYEVRMRPFLHLSIPEPPDFQEFENATLLLHMTDDEILGKAQRNVIQAKTAWDDLLKQTWNNEATRSDETHSHQRDTSGDSSAACIEEQWTQDAKNVMKSCIGTSVLIAVLKRKLEQGVVKDIQPGRYVDLPGPGDKDYWHKHWLVPRIVG